MQHYTANIMVENLLLECFFSTKTLLEQSEGVNRSFTEEHSHASYELLICKRGEGFQFVNNCAHAYGDHSVFLFAPFTQHAHISGVESPEIRCSIRFEVAKEQYLKLFTYTDENPEMGMNEILGYAGMLSFKDEQLYIDLNKYFMQK